MDAIVKLIGICNAFKSGEYSVKEFQARIETVYLPDACKYTLEKEQHNASNLLEEIIYFYGDEAIRGAKVADDLIYAALEEQKRLENV